MVSKREKPAENNLDPNGYLTTFSDLVTLLLTFFVLLLSMSNMDMQKMEKLFTNFTIGTGVLEITGLGTVPETNRLTKIPLDKVPGEDILRDIFFKKTKNNAGAIFDDKNVKIKVYKKGFAFVFGTQMMFEPGKAEIKKEAMVDMVRLAKIIKQINKPISIEGHTDDILPPLNSKYHSNWELSMARALSVFDVMVDKFGVNPWKIRVVAFADGQPVLDNNSAKSRSQNRRIEILFAWLN